MATTGGAVPCAATATPPAPTLVASVEPGAAAAAAVPAPLLARGAKEGVIAAKKCADADVGAAGASFTAA